MLIVALIAALAAAQPLEGRWSAQKEFCDRPQEDESAPAIIRPGKLDQHEAHCRWGALTPAGTSAWTAKGVCSVEGSPTKGSFRFSLAGNTLTMKGPDGVSSKFHRCPMP